MNNPKIVAIIMATVMTQLCGYEFSFFNDTATPIAIAIQFADGEKEPLYKLHIKPGTMKSFVPGTIDIPDIKWSFCLKNIYYTKNPTMQERAHNFARISHWEKTVITWVDRPLATSPQKPHVHEQHKHIGTSHERILIEKQTPRAASTSLCKDRHFEITENEYGAIIITGSRAE